MNKKIKILSIAIMLSLAVSAVYAHTYVAVYNDENNNTVGIVSYDYSNNYISVSINCSDSENLLFQGMDNIGNMYYKSGIVVVSISKDVQTIILGNINTGETFIFRLCKVSQIN